MDHSRESGGLQLRIEALERENARLKEAGRNGALALAERKKFEHLLGSFVDGNPIPTFIIDGHHNVTYWNKSLENISGIRSEDMVGTRDQWQAFYDRKRPVMADLIVDRVDEKEFWVHYKNNSEFTTLQESRLIPGAFESQDFFPRFGKNGMWLFVTACPLTDETGQVIGAIETFQDVTRLISAQKALSKNEKKYRALFENAGDALFILDQDRFIDCNRLSMSLFNCTDQDIIGHSIFNFSPETQSAGIDSRKLLYRKIQKAYGGTPQKFQWACHTLTGEKLDTDITLSRVEVYGRFVLQAVIRDITARKKMEEMMVQSEKMLSVGGLAAGMAHEINNPLAGMMQNAQVLVNRLTKSLPANEKAAAMAGVSMKAVNAYMKSRDIIALADNIHGSGKRAAKIIRNILSFAKQSTSIRSRNDMAELLEKTVEIACSDYDLTKRYDFKEIEIERHYENDVPLVSCDDSKIQQVFLNILKNGAEAMHTQKGRSRFILNIYKEIPFVCVEIIDNGPGIDIRNRRRIFEPFFTTKGEDKGTGLGLSVSYFIIVKDHAGEIMVDSVPDGGTKFTIKLRC